MGQIFRQSHLHKMVVFLVGRHFALLALCSFCPLLLDSISNSNAFVQCNSFSASVCPFQAHMAEWEEVTL